MVSYSGRPIHVAGQQIQFVGDKQEQIVFKTADQFLCFVQHIDQRIVQPSGCDSGLLRSADFEPIETRPALVQVAVNEFKQAVRSSNEIGEIGPVQQISGSLEFERLSRQQS